MRHPLTFALTLLLAAAPAPLLASAQSAAPATGSFQAGTVQDISVLGASDLLANFVRATLSVQPGTPLSGVNLRQVEQQVVESGYFSKAVAELRTVGGRDTLVITVVPNATIQSVSASGLNYLSADAFKNSIAELLNIAPGATLNTVRLDQAKEALAQNYRQEGFPFAPSISAEAKPNADGTVTVNFVVDESAPVSRLEIEGVTLLPQATVQGLFRPIFTAKRFTTESFFAAASALEQAYLDAGYIQSGVDPRGLSLENGTLKVKVIESRVADVDLSPLGTLSAPPSLETQAGQPLTLAKLQADVRSLANTTGQPVGFALQPDPNNPARVTVLFGSAGVQGGPVKSISVTGNTKVSSAQLLAAVKTKVGDIYSPQLAQDDFAALRDVYRKAGYEISTRDALTFEDGVLTFNVREVRLAGFELAWQGAHRTQDRVILRELPQGGQVFNAKEVQAAFGRISALGFVTINDVRTKVNPERPEDVTYVLTLSESRSGIPVDLGLNYDSLQGGWGGQVGYQNNNAFGRGDSFAVSLGATQNQAGQNWIGNVSYTVPWLDLNFGDFRTRRTSLTVGAGSNVGSNNPLKDADGNDTGRDYTVRNTGVTLGLGRNITPQLTGNLSLEVNNRTNYLEAIQEGETSALTDEQATAALPPSSLTSRVGAGLSYDNTDVASFPGRGVRSYGSAGYNFGRAGDNPLGWSDGQFGVSGYYGFGSKITRSFGIETYRQVLAARANTGATFGRAPEGTGFYVGGSNTNPALELRGLNDGQLFGVNYFTSSLEYRYDFGLTNSFTQGIYGIVFADYGTVWGGTAGTQNAYAVGAGVQLNLGLGGVQLPSLRFDYGYSPQKGNGANNPAGGYKFGFRLGNFW